MRPLAQRFEHRVFGDGLMFTSSTAFGTFTRTACPRLWPPTGLASAELIVIERESTDRWQALLEACHREFRPETEIETELVTEIAAARWRLRRCWSMETSLFDMEVAKQRENLQIRAPR
jgi:hypothetical protein